MNSWKLDMEDARKYAMTNAKDPRYPPHWLRCIAMRTNAEDVVERCALGHDHSGDHVAPKPRKAE